MACCGCGCDTLLALGLRRHYRGSIPIGGLVLLAQALGGHGELRCDGWTDGRKEHTHEHTAASNDTKTSLSSLSGSLPALLPLLLPIVTRWFRRHRHKCLSLEALGVWGVLMRRYWYISSMPVRERVLSQLRSQSKKGEGCGVRSGAAVCDVGRREEAAQGWRGVACA